MATELRKENATIKTETLESSALVDGKVIKTQKYYLIITTGKGTSQINIGKTTYDNITKIIQ